MVKISTIMAVYNVEEYLDKCFHHLLAQTYPVHEIIAVNDGSTDGSGKILESWAKKDNRIRVIHQENTGGPGAPRNRGIEAATGDYIHFLDADDYIENEFYEKLIEMITATNAEIAAATLLKFNSRRTWMPPTFEKLGLFAKNRVTNLYTTPDLIHNLSSTNKLFSRSFLTNNQLTFLEGGASEEIHFTTRCFYLAKKVAIQTETAYYWRRREAPTNRSITQQKAQYRSVQDRLVSHKKIDAFLQERGLMSQRYIKDVRAILDFVRHASALYRFSEKEQERFFTEVNDYLNTIDEKAYDYLPHYARRYYLSRLFFLKKRRLHELVATGTPKYGTLPVSIETKEDGGSKVYFDFSYLASEYQDDPLFSEKVGVPETFLAVTANLLRAALSKKHLKLKGYGYNRYLPVKTKKDTSITIMLKNRRTKAVRSFPAKIHASPALKGMDVSHRYCKFSVVIPTDAFRDWLRRGDIVDLEAAVETKGVRRIKRLRSITAGQKLRLTRLKNRAPFGRLYTTQKNNISIQPQRIRQSP